MSRSGILLAITGVAWGIAAEGAAFGLADPELWILDLAVGWVFIGCGLVLAARLPANRSGPLTWATGFAWFLGNFGGVEPDVVAWLSTHLVHLHRGLLVHLIAGYPHGRLGSRAARTVVGVGYATSLLTPVWGGDVVALLAPVLLAAFCAHEHARSIGGRRRARLQALVAASGLVLVLAGGAVARLALPSGEVSPIALIAYQVTLCLIAGGCLVGLGTEAWQRTRVTDLVVELGTGQSPTLPAALARALGDPSLEVGYWFEPTQTFIGADGREFALPEPSSDRSVTFVANGGELVAAIVHDPGVLDDPWLRDAIGSATGLAAAHARLQGELRARAAEVEASRRRILAARDDERERLEHRLRQGAERRLEAVTEVLGRARRSAATRDSSERIAQAAAQVDRTRQELRELARGIHPRVLSEHGLARAIRSMVDALPLPVDVEIGPERLPLPVEAAAYFVCAEALANAVKHAAASTVSVSVTRMPGHARVVVRDDGVGGADPTGGSGLRGLADRVATLGGTLLVESPRGRGTRLTAEIPLGGEDS